MVLECFEGLLSGAVGLQLINNNYIEEGDRRGWWRRRGLSSVVWGPDHSATVGWVQQQRKSEVVLAGVKFVSSSLRQPNGDLLKTTRPTTGGQPNFLQSHRQLMQSHTDWIKNTGRDGWQ